MRLKVSSNNFYVGNKQADDDAVLLGSHNVHLAGIQEGYRRGGRALQRKLRKTHKTFWRKAKNADRQMAFGEVPVVYDKDLDVIKTWARLISKRAQEKNIGMPRAATAVRFRKGGETVTFINTHCNAAVQNRKTKKPFARRIPRVNQYVKGMIILELMVRNAKRRGDLVVLVGDLNYRTVSGKPWRFSPQAMFKRTKMNYVHQGVDYIAYSSEFKVEKFYRLQKHRHGGDHPWLFAVLTS